MSNIQMTTEVDSILNNYKSEFERSIQDAAGSPLADLRKAAMMRFLVKGFPKRYDEEWRFTDMRSIVETPFAIGGFEQQHLTAEQSGSALFPELKANRLVFVNGHYVPALSVLQELPEGMIIGSLAEMLSTYPERITKALTQELVWGATPFTELNKAFVEDGALIAIPNNAIVSDPILLVFIANPGAEATVSHPRTIVQAGSGSQATIIESYIGLSNTDSSSDSQMDHSTHYLTNAVTEIYADENAVIDHYKLNQESSNAYHVANTLIELQRSANFTSHNITLGGLIVRNDINAGLRGPGIECTLNGLYMGRDRQIIDNHTAIDHAMPHCNSHEVYKGILNGWARGVFNGKIFVREDAQKTDAKQTNKTLLLSKEATIHTKPQLEILADDVRCTHGATVGQLNADALFYLRTRGIGAEQARAILTFAFANDIVNRIKVEPVRIALESALLNELN